MTEPVSNVMLVITTYSLVALPSPARELELDWCLELAASLDDEPELSPVRSKYIFETLAVHPTRKFAPAANPSKPARRSLNSPYFKLLKARAQHVGQQQKQPVSSLSLAVNPNHRAYLALTEEREQGSFAVKQDSKKLRQLVCKMSELQKIQPTAPQDAVRTTNDPVRTVRFQPFFVAQPMFSPA